LEVGAVRDPGQLYPPGRDSVPGVTEIVLVDTVLTDTVSLVSVEKDPEGVTLDGLPSPGADEVSTDRVLELAAVDDTTDGPELVAAQETKVLLDGPVGPEGKGLLAGGAPYVGTPIEDIPVEADPNEPLSLLAEGVLGIPVVAGDGIPVEPLEAGPGNEVVLKPDVPLKTGLDDPTWLLDPSPAVFAELETGGIVALVGASVPSELSSPQELVTCDDVLPTSELEPVVPGDGGLVVVGCTLGQL
jgi:hypothetical protein